MQDTFDPVYLDVGFYRWNVHCLDVAGNVGFASSNRTVNITQPDLTLNSYNILFLNQSPTEEQNITINATLRNDGLTAAGKFLVQFYDGNPVNDAKIGPNITINGLSSQANTTINASYVTR